MSRSEADFSSPAVVAAFDKIKNSKNPENYVVFGFEGATTIVLWMQRSFACFLHTGKSPTAVVVATGSGGLDEVSLVVSSLPRTTHHRGVFDRYAHNCFVFVATTDQTCSEGGPSQLRCSPRHWYVLCKVTHQHARMHIAPDNPSTRTLLTHTCTGSDVQKNVVSNREKWVVINWYDVVLCLHVFCMW